MSVLFSNTRTRLLYNELEIFKTKHELTVSNPFNIQFEFTAGDRLSYNGFPPKHCTVFMRYCNTLMSPGNENSRDQF